MEPTGERGEAFVVWLDPFGEGPCCGQVERVATSERVPFANADELVAVITGATGPGPDRGPGSAGPSAEEP